MDSLSNFRVAEQANRTCSWIFWIVTGTSALLLIFPKPLFESVLFPALIVLTIAGICASVVTVIYQNSGNRSLRASQLTDAFGAGVGDALRHDYYNSPLPHSVERLASTTLENTLFTTEVLKKMLRKERAAVGLYVVIFVLLLAYRSTSLNWLVFLSQSLFSADVILNWLKMERFRMRALYVHEQLRQFFLQGGSAQQPNGMAIIWAAFTDYECAKDEAAFPLDSKIFTKINPGVSKRWEQMKATLKIEHPQG